MTYKFEDVVAWQKAHRFAVETYKATRHFPEDERFGLVSQFRRAAVSIEANIAEGYKKLSRTDKLRFFNISQGSIEECRDYLLLARDLEYFAEGDFERMYLALEDASRMLQLYCDGIIRNNGVKD